MYYVIDSKYLLITFVNKTRAVQNDEPTVSPTMIKQLICRQAMRSRDGDEGYCKNGTHIDSVFQVATMVKVKSQAKNLDK